MIYSIQCSQGVVSDVCPFAIDLPMLGVLSKVLELCAGECLGSTDGHWDL